MMSQWLSTCNNKRFIYYLFSVDELKKKWRGLRDTFGKELKKLNNKKSGQAANAEQFSKWPYFQLLMFLQSTMSRRDLQGNVPDTYESSDGEDSVNTNLSSNYTPSPLPGPSSEQSDQEIPKHFKSPLKKKAKRSQPQEIDAKLLEIEEEKLQYFKKSANDPDAQFLMSLLPFLKDIPKHRKLIVRSRLEQVLIDEQNAHASSVVQKESSTDLAQFSDELNMSPNTSTLGQSQQHFLMSQQPSAVTHYVMQFNPDSNM